MAENDASMGGNDVEKAGLPDRIEAPNEPGVVKRKLNATVGDIKLFEPPSSGGCKTEDSVHVKRARLDTDPQQAHFELSEKESASQYSYPPDANPEAQDGGRMALIDTKIIVDTVQSSLGSSAKKTRFESECPFRAASSKCAQIKSEKQNDRSLDGHTAKIDGAVGLSPAESRPSDVISAVGKGSKPSANQDQCSPVAVLRSDVEASTRTVAQFIDDQQSVPASVAINVKGDGASCDSDADGSYSDKAESGAEIEEDNYSSYYNFEDQAASCSDLTGRLNHEYDLLDETKDFDDEEEGEDVDDDDMSSDSSIEGENGLSDGEVDAMLDQQLEEYQARKKTIPSTDAPPGGQSPNENDNDMSREREKVILKVRGQDHFEVLPEGWLEVSHSSGMPLYLHKHSRVCTLSKPYFLGPGSVRKHEVPISAIPCLQYRRELEREKQPPKAEKDEGQRDTCPVMDITSTIPDENADNSLNAPIMEAATSKSDSLINAPDSTNTNEDGPPLGAIHPNAKIQTVQENTREKSIDGLKLRDYCSLLFEFETITVRRFKTWAGRRNHQKKQNLLHRPTLPIGTKLITCPLPPVPDKKDGVFVNPRREFVMNPNGKSYVCILHEYVQHAMRVQPRYTFKEMENASTPYGATVLIGNMKYGSGFGSSKKHAKLEAAKATLLILIPQMENINPDDKSAGAQQDLAFFDAIRVEDPRISELCAKAGQSSPYQILLECLRRNHGMGDTQIKFEMHTLKHQKNEFKMTVGKHVAKVICKNKRDGKQRASQSILQILHPHISTWGSLLRLYGKGSCKTLKEKKVEEQLITELQARTTQNKPNKAILNKLKEEMLKLKTKQNLVVPIGKFISGDLEPPSSSGSNLKNVDL